MHKEYVISEENFGFFILSLIGNNKWALKRKGEEKHWTKEEISAALTEPSKALKRCKDTFLLSLSAGIDV